MEKSKILIIEDDKATVDILISKMKKERYEIKCVQSGAEGIEQTVIYDPDLILLSTSLEDMNGFDVCTHIYSKYQIPIIMIIETNNFADKIHGQTCGAADFITKNINYYELYVRMENTIARQYFAEEGYR